MFKGLIGSVSPLSVPNESFLPDAEYNWQQSGQTDWESITEYEE